MAMKVVQVVISFDGESLSVKHPPDAMLTLAMLSLADAEIKSKMHGHAAEPPKPMIVPASRARVAYPPPPEPK